jgi:hypothetical protein
MAPNLSAGDITMVERPHNVRIIVSIPGRYNLANRRDSAGERREFACRVVGMSPQEMVFAAPVVGAIGERVIAHIERFGKIDGRISRVMERGFVITIAATDEEREKLAAKIQWLEHHKNHDLPEGRKHGRIVPREPLSRLVLADGSRLSCLVMDMSISGAAVSADLVPEIGLPLAVGSVPGGVVRHFAEGFAIRFIETLNPKQLESLLIKP